MDLGLEGRACAITGASRGIGLAVAERLCRERARVLLVGRSADSLDEAVSRCSNAGGEAQGLALDVTDADAGERIVAAAAEPFGALEVLVNNAGTSRRHSLEEATDDDWQAAWELNVMAPMRAMRAAIPGMIERGWGRVVNVSSSAGKRPNPQTPEYSVAKAAELSLSRVFADTYAKRGVLVNAICPGPAKSELWMAPGGLLDQSMETGGYESREQTLEAVGSGRPVGRLADVGEIADAIVFLCSERASYVAGAAWSVDGGSVPVII
ncbi:MAG TPA: SDR family oxidoreductase [Solirubrobacterales bacterium]|jgi:3-oxoacyl-[acyl-carrier protein] reductase|nr:SDR family oxidoreductase [Solirubrobacterales bacterium]